MLRGFTKRLFYSIIPNEAKVYTSSFGFCVIASKNAGLTKGHRPKGHRLTVKEAGGKEMVPHQCPECKSVIAHKPGCSLIPKNKPPQDHRLIVKEAGGNKLGSGKPGSPWYDTDNVDKTKLRRKIEEDLRKDMTLVEMMDLAEKRGIEIPRHPATPPDYHNEPGRPYFSPMQVRHASDLEKLEDYILVLPRGRERFRFHMFEYRESAGWFMLGISEEEPRSTGQGGFDYISLFNINLHPFIQEGKDNLWNDGSWLEFAPPATDCDCRDHDNELEEIPITYKLRP